MNKEQVIEILENAIEIHDIPNNAGEIINMLRNPNDIDVDELCLKMEGMEELNNLILKNVNSGIFQLQKKIDNLKEAVVYLGLQSVHNLFIFFLAAKIISTTQKSKRSFSLHIYWKHVLGTSVAAQMLSEKTKQGDMNKLFTYGLIHDIGILLLDTYLPDLLDEISDKLKIGMHQVVAERSVLGGLTHSEIGLWLCKKWNIAEDITDIVSLHHTPLHTLNKSADVRIMYIADSISTRYYEKLLGVNLYLNLNRKIMDSLKVTDKDVLDISARLSEEVEKAERYFIK